jgi:hypothetical protein
VRRAGVIAAVILGVAVLVGAVTWLVAFRDTAEPVTVDEAVTSFRTDTEPAPGAAAPTPEGVYAYGTDGFETTDALTGVTHHYPRRSTITVRAAPCGVSLIWRVLEGRSTAWRYCITDDGWYLQSQDERHTFFRRTETTAYTCADTPIRPARRPVGLSWRVSCSTDGATETGTARIVGRRPWWPVAGGPRRRAVLVRKSTSFGGEIRGTARHDLWFDEASGLPIRIDMVSRTTNDSPIGDVRYEEDVTLRLLSLEPRR